MGRFNGHSQAAGRHAVRRRVGQRQAVTLLRPLIDASMSKAPSRTRDDARRAVRELIANANWRTPFVLRNIGCRRARYLARLGLDVPAQYLTKDASALEQWKEQQK